MKKQFGPEGGHLSKCGFEIYIPPGALDHDVTIIALLQMYDCSTSPIDLGKFRFSPILILEPHGLQFKKPVKLRFTSCAVPQGWVLTLMSANCCELDNSWKSVLQCKDMGEVVATPGGGCTYNPALDLLSITRLDKKCWVGKNGDTWPGTKQMICSVFGYRPSQRQQRWILDVIIHDGCDTILQVETYGPFKPNCYHRDIA